MLKIQFLSLMAKEWFNFYREQEENPSTEARIFLPSYVPGRAEVRRRLLWGGGGAERRESGGAAAAAEGMGGSGSGEGEGGGGVLGAAGGGEGRKLLTIIRESQAMKYGTPNK